MKENNIVPSTGPKGQKQVLERRGGLGVDRLSWGQPRNKGEHTS